MTISQWKLSTEAWKWCMTCTAMCLKDSCDYGFRETLQTLCPSTRYLMSLKVLSKINSNQYNSYQPVWSDMLRMVDSTIDKRNGFVIMYFKLNYVKIVSYKMPMMELHYISHVWHSGDLAIAALYLNFCMFFWKNYYKQRHNNNWCYWEEVLIKHCD